MSGLKFNLYMLIASLLFWEGYTNTFYLRFRMVTPTLFDIVAITGLRPTRETFGPIMMSKTEPIFEFNRTTYKYFVEDIHETSSEEVSDQEHISFLTYWPSRFVFGSNSL